MSREKKYEVAITRTAWGTVYFDVVASSVKEAKQIATEAAADTEFKTDDYEYKVDSVLEK